MKKLTLAFMLLFATYCYATTVDKVQAMTGFKGNNYLGTWYEIARLPLSFEKKCMAPITANYISDSGKINVTNTCWQTDGEYNVANGVASFNAESTTAKLKVTFLPGWISWLGFGKSDYWVLYTDYTNIALVGTPDRKYLWILARTEQPEAATVTQMVDFAQKLNYHTESLIYNYPQYQPVQN